MTTPPGSTAGHDPVAEAGVDDVVAGLQFQRRPRVDRLAPGVRAGDGESQLVSRGRRRPPWRSVSSAGSSSMKREGRLRSARPNSRRSRAQVM